MATVHHTTKNVKPAWDDVIPVSATLTPCDLEPDTGPDPADAAWWAGLSADTSAVSDPCTDRAWYRDEAALCRERHAAGVSPSSGVLALVAWACDELDATLDFFRCDDVRDYLAHPDHYRSDARPVELPRLSLPRSPLAMALQLETAWYAHLDTPAAELLCRRLLLLAETAEEYGVATEAEYRDADAAFRAALEEAYLESLYPEGCRS